MNTITRQLTKFRV